MVRVEEFQQYVESLPQDYRHAYSKVAQNLADKVDEHFISEMEKLNSFPIQKFWVNEG